MSAVVHFFTPIAPEPATNPPLQNCDRPERWRSSLRFCPGPVRSNHSMKLLALVTLWLFSWVTIQSAELRIGIIGCDTSHSVAFTELINDSATKGHVPGGKVVAAFKGGSADIPSSISRIEGYSKTLGEKYGVVFYDTIEELCKNVDCVLLESVDGRPHLNQVRPVIKAGKTVYIDKPMAGSLRDVLEIFKLAREAKVPMFSASGLRYGRDTQAVRNGSLGKVDYAETYGPCEIEPHHPDLFWYGVHGTESLFTVLGTGCQSVKRVTTPDGKIEVTGTWSGGRIGILRESHDFRGKAKGEKGEAPVGSFDGYGPLVAEIMQFFKTRIAPVKPEETIEIFAFMEAADESKSSGGQEIKIADTIRKAETK
jgi:hypothetical protein